METGMISCRNSLNIRFVDSRDRDFWLSLDRHIRDEEFDRKVRDRMGYVLTVQNEPAGLLRYSLFWDNIPFCNLLYVAEDHQRRGYGRMLMEHWERDMHMRGYDLVMTSTQADENAQHFYRALGYKDCGGLILPFPGHEQPMKIILTKPIGNPE